MKETLIIKTIKVNKTHQKNESAIAFFIDKNVFKAIIDHLF